MNFISCQLEFDCAVELSSQNQYHEAITHFGRAISLNPRHFASLINRGTVYSLLKLWPLAEQDFTQAISIEPSDPSGYYNRFVVFLSTKRYKQALADLYCSLSCFNILRGVALQSLKHLGRALSLVESNHFAYIQRAELYRSIGQERLALGDLNVALELDPNNRWALCLRCLVLRSLREFERAARDHDLALGLATTEVSEGAVLQVAFGEMTQQEISREIESKMYELKELRSQIDIEQPMPEARPLQFTKCKSSVSLGKRLGSSNQFIRIDSNESTLSGHDSSLNARLSRLISEKVGQVIITPPEQELPRALKPSFSKPEFEPLLTSRSGYSDKDYFLEYPIGSFNKQPTENISRGGRRGSQIKKLAELITEDDDFGANKSVLQPILTPQNYTLDDRSMTSKTYNTLSQKIIPANRKWIEVEIVAATLTHNTELFGNMSPYCTILYENEVKTTKVASRAGKNPVWNEAFTFSIKDSNLIKIEVWDKEMIKKDDLVGLGSTCIYESANKIQLKHDNKPAGTVFIKVKLV